MPCLDLCTLVKEDNNFHGTLGVIKSQKLDSSFFSLKRI